MANEVDRIIQETNKLQESIKVAQALKGRFLRYLMITSIVTAVLTIGIAWGLAIAMGSQAQDQHIENNTKALVCILSDPKRTPDDIQWCLREAGVELQELPLLKGRDSG